MQWENQWAENNHFLKLIILLKILFFHRITIIIAYNIRVDI